MYNLHEFLYFLCEVDGRCRTILNGIVTSLNKKVYLQQSPDGWQDILILWERSLVGYLTVRNYSLPMGFVGVAATILRNDFYKFNLDRALYLQIYQLHYEITDTYYRCYHKFLYKGQLDFSTTVDKQGESRVEMNIMEGGLMKKINARKSTKFTIPFDDDADLLYDDGIDLHKRVTWTVPPGIEVSRSDFEEFAVPTYTKGVDGIAPGVAVFDQQFEDVQPNEAAYLADSTNALLKVSPNFTAPVVFNLKGQVNIICTSGTLSGGQLQLRLQKQDGIWAGDGGQPFANGLKREPGQFVNMTTGTAYTFYIDEVCTLNPGDRIFLIGTMFRPSGSENFTIKFAEGTEFYVEFHTRQLPTYTYVFRPEVLFRKLVGKITGNEADAESILLPTSTFFIRSGTSIRQDPAASVITSYADFCKAYDVLHMGSYGVQNNKVRFESRDYAFNLSVVTALGESIGVENSPAIDLMGNSIKIGHQEQQLSDANSKADFNGFHIYTTPVEVIADKEIDLQSPYFAGPFEQEEIRINLAGKDTTADEKDNRVYIVDVIRDGATHIVQDGSFSAALQAMLLGNGVKIAVGQKLTVTSPLNSNNYTVTGVGNLLGFGTLVFVDIPVIDEVGVSIDIIILKGAIYTFNRTYVVTAGVPSPETIYNVGCCASLLMERHSRWLRSICYKYEPGVIKFQTTNINPDLVLDGKKDNRDFVLSEMGARIFLPFYIISNPLTPTELTEVMELTPNTGFSQVINNQLIDGYNFKSGIAPNSLKTQEFKLLLGPDNDPEILII